MTTEKIYIIFLLYEKNDHYLYSETVETCYENKIIETLHNMIDVYYKQLCPYVQLDILTNMLNEKVDLKNMDVFNISSLSEKPNDVIRMIIIKLYLINEHIDLMNRFKSKTDRYSRFWIDIK